MPQTKVLLVGYNGANNTGAEALLRAAVQFGMSARALHRILRLARTIADLEGAEAIRTQHLADALQYRSRRS